MDSFLSYSHGLFDLMYIQYLTTVLTIPEYIHSVVSRFLDLHHLLYHKLPITKNNFSKSAGFQADRAS